MLINTALDYVDWVNRWIGQLLAWLTLPMVLISALVVVLRYVFGWGVIWLQEIPQYIHAMIFLGAAGYAFSKEAHVRVDFLYQHMSAHAKAMVNLVGTLLLLMPFCVTILWYSWDFVINAWATLETSNRPRGLPAVFILKTFIWVYPVVLLLHGIVLSGRSALIFAGECRRWK